MDELRDALKANGLSAPIEFDPDGQPHKWTRLDILAQDGEPLAQIEHDKVVGKYQDRIQNLEYLLCNATIRKFFS